VRTTQRFAALAVLSAAVFIGSCFIRLPGLPVAAGNSQTAPIDDRRPSNTEFVTADLELGEPAQGTAILSMTDVVTPVLGPEPTVLLPAPIDIATDAAASFQPVASVAQDPGPPILAIARDAMSAKASSADGEFYETSVVLAIDPAAEIPLRTPSYEALLRLPELRSGGSFTSDPLKENPQPAGAVETPSECPVPQLCIDDYLWALYERTPKIDTNKVVQRVKSKAKVTVKKKNKTVTVAKTVIKTRIKYVVGDFTWKDPIAAQRAGMSLKDYVIGGMDPGFKVKLYRAFRAMEHAGHMPGITSGFRDDYRQSIASGTKAASDSSYHGGSRRGGYGYGLAADLVSLKGETRHERHASSQELWNWIDSHEEELGIGRPYLHRDPPHVAPLDGGEYAAKRGRMIAQKREMQKETRQRLASLRKVRSLQIR
jgi:hypothetical protein